MDKSFEHDIEILDSVRKKIEEEGDNHFLSNIDTPILDNAFDLSDEEKISKIEEHFREIMKILGLDLNDDGHDGPCRRLGAQPCSVRHGGREHLGSDSRQGTR